MSKQWLRKGDSVVAIAGNEKGRTGSILEIDGDRILVQGLNVRKKAVKKSQENPQGQMLEIERPIHRSNLAVCDDKGKPIKIRVATNDEGERQLVYNTGSGTQVYRSIKRPSK